MLAPATRVGRNMKRTKQKAIDAISSLPVDATWEDISYCLDVRQKIEEGIKAADQDRVLSHDEVKRLFANPNESKGSY
jgi:hypothetical protein